jgi:hypothetical protein
MSEKDNKNFSVWSQFQDAKKSAFGQEEQIHEPRTIEELEAMIAETAASSGLPETGLPPRAVVHPSKGNQLTTWFYRSLVILFAALVFGLFYWGRKYYGG